MKVWTDGAISVGLSVDLCFDWSLTARGRGEPAASSWLTSCWTWRSGKESWTSITAWESCGRAESTWCRPRYSWLLTSDPWPLTSLSLANTCALSNRWWWWSQFSVLQGCHCCCLHINIIQIIWIFLFLFDKIFIYK